MSAPTTMQAVRLSDPDGERAVVEPVPVPAPGTGDALIRVHAGSYTPGELSWPSTWVDRGGRDRTPTTPGHEVSGEVVALGWGATGVAVGDAVYALTDWYRDGTLAEYVAVEARDLAPKPASASHAQAAALPLAGLTAWQGLFVHGQLRSGQTVAVVGAAGGVGALAVQLAADAGAQVIGVARPERRAVVEALGAHGFAERLEQIDGAVDVVFDTVGVAPAGLRPGGVFVSIFAPAEQERPDVRQVYFVVEPDRATLRTLAEQVDQGTLRPAPIVTCPLDQAPERVLAKERGELAGKLVVEVA